MVKKEKNWWLYKLTEYFITTLFTYVVQEGISIKKKTKTKGRSEEREMWLDRPWEKLRPSRHFV
jgi:hypothetical protein